MVTQSPTIQPYQITETVSVKLDGSGNGKASISPGQPSPAGGVGASRNSGLSWDVVGTAVSVSTNTKEATAKTYISYGGLSQTSVDFVGATDRASTGDSGTFTAYLRPGDWVTTVWSGGDANAVATMRIIGTVNPPGM
jgi:hypothetical protein